MTDLFRLLTPDMKRKWRLSTFVETGLARGKGVIYALGMDFKAIYSIEVDPKWVHKAVSSGLSQMPAVEIVHATSVEGLESVASRIVGNACWWLDAHFPEGDLGPQLPLQEELEVIRKKRALRRDVLIMDDIHHYSIDLKWLEVTHDLEEKENAIIATPKVRM